MNFHHKVAALSPSPVCKFVITVSPEQATELVNSGATAFSVRGYKGVRSIELTKSQVARFERDKAHFAARSQPLGIKRTIVADSLVYSFPTPRF